MLFSYFNKFFDINNTVVIFNTFILHESSWNKCLYESKTIHAFIMIFTIKSILKEQNKLKFPNNLTANYWNDVIWVLIDL